MSLIGKNVLVVGAASSIGKSVIDGLMLRGANVLATVNKLKPQYLMRPEITVAQADLMNSTSLEQFCSSVVPFFGQIDVVIFLSGYLKGRNLHDYNDDLMQQVMTVNFSGQATLLRHLLTHLSEGYLVLMVSSISAERGSFDPIYAAAKAAQIGLVKSLAIWLAPKVRINAIAPALIDGSTMFNDMTAERREHHLKQTPTGRLTTLCDLAGVILNLCEPEWSNLNGQVIRLNGGSHV